MDCELLKAIRLNDIDRVIDLLRMGADPTIQDNYAIQHATQNGHLEIARLLLADPRVDPTVCDNYSIRYTALNGRLEVVQLLLADRRVDPAHLNNATIRLAAERGHLEVVRLLLSDPRVDPTAEHNYAIRYAAKNGHLEVVQLLLTDPRVDPTECNNYAIREAVANGHAEIARLLAEIPEVLIPTINIYLTNNTLDRYVGIFTTIDGPHDLLNWAAQVGSVNLVRREINNGVNPAVNNNAPLRHASENGHSEVVRLLLADPRVNPAIQNNYPIRYATQNFHFEVATLLLTDPRVDPTGFNNSLFRNAVYLKQQNLVLFLFNLPGVLLPTLDYYLQESDLNQIRELAAMTGACPVSDTDPTISNEDLMVWGAAVGSLNLVLTLVWTYGVDPTFADNSAIVVAQEKGHTEIVTYLSRV